MTFDKFAGMHTLLVGMYIGVYRMKMSPLVLVVKLRGRYLHSTVSEEAQ
jgi:hypothetical protein